MIPNIIIGCQNLYEPKLGRNNILPGSRSIHLILFQEVRIRLRFNQIYTLEVRYGFMFYKNVLNVATDFGSIHKSFFKNLIGI